MKIAILFISLFTFNSSFAGVSLSESEIASYYQPTEKQKEIAQEIDFWTIKYNSTPSQKATYAVQLANAYSASFALNGKINHLKKAELLLLESLESNPMNPASVQRSLANNYISQHRFCEALDLLYMAEMSGDRLHATYLMQFDVLMELGEEALAEDLLLNIKDKESFDVLVRKAKWQDHNGHLDKAISLLERAKEIALNSKNKTQISWIYSNLGDFYGHYGNYELSKDHFIMALQMNPADWYSVKGLAWMSWSLNGASQKALNMLEKIETNNETPIIKWLQLEILKSQNNPDAKRLTTLITEIKSKDYGSMYDHLLFDYAITQNYQTQAMIIATRQVAERPTPQSFAMLARAYSMNAQPIEALNITQSFVIGQTFEPKVLSLIYPILDENSEMRIEISEELRSAQYELGPSLYKVLFKA